MYEIVIEKRAERDFKRLTPDIRQQITPQILALHTNPRPYGVRKLVGSENDWRIASGDYRIIYEIDDRAKIVRILKIRHRREAYR